MKTPDGYLLGIACCIVVGSPTLACEPVVPFIQVVAPALSLTGSASALALVVGGKSLLFALLAKQIPKVRAALFMFVGNVLTSIVGVIAAVMLGSPAIWLVSIPVVFGLAWLPARRLVAAPPRPWFGRQLPWEIAFLMTVGLAGSCFLFMLGQAAIGSNRLALYWVVKLAAVYLALIASITLTAVWEEWVIWKLASSPEGVAFFGPVLRTNLYTLLVVMAIGAVLMLPKRLASPDFLVKRSTSVASAVSVPPN